MYHSPHSNNENAPFEAKLDPGSALLRFFKGHVEYCFQSQLGVVDQQLVDYVSSLLINCTRTVDARFAMTLGKNPTLKLEMMLRQVAEIEDDVIRRGALVKIGDLVLFATGTYPMAIDEGGHDYLQKKGEEAYYQASRFEIDGVKPDAELLDRLGDYFELCVYGVQEVQRNIKEEASLSQPGDPFIL